MAEFDITEREAEAAIATLLSGAWPIVARWRRRPTEAEARFLEDLYAKLAVGALANIQPATST